MDKNERDMIKLLEQKMETLTKSQKRVADYIISNPTEAVFLTVDQIANRVKTSSATVVRMAAEFGYSGYVELQKELQQSLKYHLEPASRLKIDATAQNGDKLIQEITKIQLDNIDNLMQTVSSEQIYQTVELMEQAIFNQREIYVCGNRSCYGVASYLSYNLNRMFQCGTLLSSETLGYHNNLNKMREGDVVIAISFLRYAQSTLDVERIAARVGAKIVAVTDSMVSPMAENADILYKLSCNTKHFHNSTLSAMLLFELLIGVLTERNRDIIQGNLESQEKVLKDLKTHVL